MRGRGVSFGVRVLTWNLEWATARAHRRGEILRRIGGFGAEVFCLTETVVGFLPEGGHAIYAEADYGYGDKGERRKVMLWSREPWREIDRVGDESMPSGRFVSGVTGTSMGDVRVVGVCIPWFGSRSEARRGLDRRERWEDHEQYLESLAEFLRGVSAQGLIVMGDFNQVIGAGSRAPERLQKALRETFPPGMRIATAEVEFWGRRSIDHIALSEDLMVQSLEVVSNLHDGRKLSDHFGVAAEVIVR